jgi:peptidoglycan/xylan/chitin deacetylase (PgdA/CDA1 family)
VSIKIIILLYHGVTTSTHHGIENYSQKHISAQDFAHQMHELAENYTVLSLKEILRRKQNHTLPEKSVVVTFDDGFENNYSVAFPILRQFLIPATFYLSTGFIGKSDTFWVDKLEYLINETPLSQLNLDSLGKQYSLQSITEKQEALKDIKFQLKTMSGSVENTITELEQVVQVSPQYDYHDYRMLTWDQVREMDKSDLCEFGGHTVDHVILSHLSHSEKEYQIAQCKTTLEAELGKSMDMFSYPEGLANHYDEEAIEILKSLEITSSPSAIFGVNTDTTSDYHLYRNMVGFTASFEQCLEGLC